MFKMSQIEDIHGTETVVLVCIYILKGQLRLTLDTVQYISVFSVMFTAFG